MVIIISGTPASGKSSVAKSLSKKFTKSAYIAVDEMRSMIVGGNIAPWLDKDGKQYDLIEKNFLDLTRNFINEGFVVIIDDVMTDEHIKRYKKLFGEVHGFLLLPSIETIKKRDLGRDPNHGMRERIDVLYPMFADVDHDELKVINSTDQTLKETVDEIFKSLK